MSIKRHLKLMVEKKASDLFYRPGGKPHMRIDGKVIPVEEEALSLHAVSKAVEELTTEVQRKYFEKSFDVDFAYYFQELERRFRVSIFMQRNSPSIVIRNLDRSILGFEDLNLPVEILKKFSQERRGLILLVGSAGSGKSTTIASMIEFINQNSQRHILTIEEPIEFVFKDSSSIINQRELGLDVVSYPVALRSFTLQSPDVIFIGNIRDPETMSASLTIAETGVLVLSTLHTINAAQTIERIVHFFPLYQHQEIRNEVSYLLKGIISLRLVPLKDKPGRVPACEVMLLTPTISRLIREGKISEISRFIEEGALYGMQSFTQSLIKLVKEGLVSEEVAADFSDNKDEFILALKGIKRA